MSSYGAGPKSAVEELERLRNGVAQLATAAAIVADSLRPLERRWAGVEERLRSVESVVDDRLRVVEERWQRHAAAADEKNRQVDATLDARWKTMQRAMENKFRQMEALLDERGKAPVQMGTEYWHQEAEHTSYALAAAYAREDADAQLYGVAGPTAATLAGADPLRDDRLTSWGSVGGHGGLSMTSHTTPALLEDATSSPSPAPTSALATHPIPKATTARLSRMVAQHHTLLRDVFNEPTTPPSRSHSFLPPTVTGSTAPQATESEATGVNANAGGGLSEEAAALLDAAKKGRAGEVRALLESGVPVGVATTLGSTPTHLAARYGHVEVLALLLEQQADCNARHYMGWTPLHESAAQEHLPCMSMLMRHGSDVESRNDLGRTPLHVASYCAREEAVRVLLEAGASTSAQDDEGNTPYDLASSDTVRRLLRPPPPQPPAQSSLSSAAHAANAHTPTHSPTHSTTHSPTPTTHHSPSHSPTPLPPSSLSPAPPSSSPSGAERTG